VIIEQKIVSRSAPDQSLSAGWVLANDSCLVFHFWFQIGEQRLRRGLQVVPTIEDLDPALAPGRDPPGVEAERRGGIGVAELSGGTEARSPSKPAAPRRERTNSSSVEAVVRVNSARSICFKNYSLTQLVWQVTRQKPRPPSPTANSATPPAWSE
jgi:hypothetical protein